MKRNNTLLWLFLLLFAGTTFAQIRNVTLFPNRVDVTGGTVSSAALSGFSASNYIVGNGAYQPGTTTPYFTIKDLGVYNSSGTWVADLPIYSENYYEPEYAPYYIRSFPELTKEMAIVPVPGSCGRFYVIYIGYELYATMVMKAIVNATNPASVYIESSSDCRLYPSGGAIPGQNGSIAVTRKKVNGNYDLYVLWRDHFKQFEITSSGISYTTSYTPSGIPDPSISNELELSHDEAFLSFEHGSTVYRYEIGALSVESANVSSSVYGIEFHSSDEDIVFAANGSVNIKKIDFSTTPATVTNIAMPTGWTSETQLEKDGQGRIYGVNSGNNPGKLFHFDESGTTFTNTNISVYSITASGGWFFPGYSLNDQLDGEDYSTFRGVPAITLNSTINSTANANPNWNDFYNCNAINLSVTTNGTQARIILTKVDVNKDPIMGGGAYSFTSSWDDPADLITDLRTFPGTSNHLLSNNGYYKLEIQSENTCDDSDSEIWWLHIHAAPTTASISLTINDTDPLTPAGVPVSPAHSWPGIWVGRYVASYNLDNSTGDITFRRIEIEEVSSTDGSFVRTILSPAEEFAVTGSVSTLSPLYLNEANVPAIGSPVNWGGGTDFFALKGLNNHYKITITVGNACGSSSDYSYIRVNSNNFRMADNGLEGTSSVTSAFPNPFDREVFLNVPAGETAKVSIVNILGSTVYEREYNSDATSSGTVRVETSDLPKGSYFYKMEVLGEIHTGTIIK